MGSLAMVDRGYRADAGIMTEPTANRIAPLCHGILWGAHHHRRHRRPCRADAELSGIRSGPVDAIELCRQMLDGIDILNRRWRSDPNKNHPLMDLPNQIIVTQIKAGEHPSSMAGRGEIIIDVQYLPREKDEFGLGGHVKREVEAHSRRSARPTLICESTRPGWSGSSTPTAPRSPADHPFVATFQGAGRRRPRPAPVRIRSAQRHRPADRARPDPDRQFRSGRPRAIASAE